MLLNRLRKFREETEKKYKEGLESSMLPWKKDVLRLHEKSDFLFYFDEFTDWNEKRGSGICLGSYAKGNPEPDTVIYLYSGQAELLGRAWLTGKVEASEEKMQGFTREKKYLCQMKLDLENQEAEAVLRKFRQLNMQLSLISDLAPEMI